MAQVLGISMAQVMGIADKTQPTHKPRAPNGSRPPKPPMTVAYRHPDNPELVASHRGPKPQWFNDLKAKGHDMEKYRVHDQTAQQPSIQ